MKSKYKPINKNSEKCVKYLTKIHGISANHPYITIPENVFYDNNLKLGDAVFIKIKQNNKVYPVIAHLTTGAHVKLVCVPKLILKKSQLKSNKEIETEIVINQEIKKEDSIKRIDLISLDLDKISRFIHEDKLYVRYKSRKTRQHFVKRFIEINRELAYIVGLYDAEGAEKSFRFTNSDPKLIKTFLNAIKNIFGLTESEFDAQITLVNKNMESEHARLFWSNLFPNINIYEKASFKYGEGIKQGSLSVLINTTTMNSIWNSIREKVRELLRNNKDLSAAYISGVLDGDGNVHKNKSLEVRCAFDSNKGHLNFAKALENLKIDYEVTIIADMHLIEVAIRKWNNIIRLFNNNAIFKNNI